MSKWRKVGSGQMIIRRAVLLAVTGCLGMSFAPITTAAPIDEATTRPASTSRQDTVDLSDPKKAFSSYITAYINADPAAIKRCLYIKSSASELFVDSEIEYGVANRLFVKAAEARFGADTDPTGRGRSFTEKFLRSQIGALSVVEISREGKEAELSTPDRRGRKGLVKTDAGWQLEGDRFANAMDRDAGEKRNRANAAMLRKLTDQLNQGKFKDLPAVQAAYAQAERDLGPLRL